MSYAVSHRLTAPVWIVHTAFAAPARARDAVRAWGERHVIGIGVAGAVAVAVQLVATVLGIVR